MWSGFLSCGGSRNVFIFSLKYITLLTLILQSLIKLSDCQVLVGERGAACTTNNDCDQRQFLQCLPDDNICECEINSSIWVDEENLCMLQENIPCRIHTNGALQPKCITNSSCIAGKCECDDGFLRNGEGKCELSYGSVCSESEKCAARFLLECGKVSRSLHPRCRCLTDGVEFAWDDNKRKCVSTVGGTCDLPGSQMYAKDDQLECVKHADCVGQGVCECKRGFTQTPEGTCMLKYGERCNHSEGLCNKYQFLNCQDGKCDCVLYGQMKYDVNANQCAFLVGESCETSESSPYEGNPGVINVKSAKCVTDSFCKNTRVGSTGGVCTCVSDLQKTSENTCSRYNKGHGLSCSTSSDCDKEKFLECVFDENTGSRCDCNQTNMYFDGHQCRVQVGRSCARNKLCADNSYCEGDWCVCMEGYSYKIGNKGCIKRGTSSESSSRSTSMNCEIFHRETIDWLQCHCNHKYASHIWVQEELGCLALVGTKCGHSEECVPNGICDELAKTCQCSTGMFTTSNRTCIPSSNSKPSVDSSKVECPEIRTLKSVGSLINSNHSGVQVQRCTNILIFFLYVVTLMQYS